MHNAVYVTAQTFAGGCRRLCPRLPTPSSTKPANRDGLHLAFKLSLSLSLVTLGALLSNSGPQAICTSVRVSAMSLLQQTLLLFTSGSCASLPLPASNRHSPHDYVALLSLPAQCHGAFYTSEWTPTSRKILASTRGI